MQTDFRKETCYDNLRISKNAWDTNLIKVSTASHATTKYKRSYLHRPTLSTSPSIGNQAVVAPSPSSPSMSVAAPPS